MGGQGQLVPAPVATARVKEESQGKASSPGGGSQSSAPLTQLEQASAVLESTEPGPRLTGKQWVTVGEVKLAPAPLGRPGEARKGPGGPGSGRTLPLLHAPTLPWPMSLRLGPTSGKTESSGISTPGCSDGHPRPS